MRELSRRALLKISLGLTGALTSYGLLRFLGYQSSPPTPTQFTLKSPREYARGSVTAVPEARAYIGRDDNGLFAISAVCTHLGCTVNQSDDGYACPCHGSKFNAGGYVLTGPARLPLDRLELTLSPEGRVVLDTTRRVPPDFRLAV